MWIKSDIILPYKIIAKFNELVKVHDDDDELWTDIRGNRYVLTPLGFVPSVQYNQKILLDSTKIELEKASSDLDAMKKKHDEYRKTVGDYSGDKIVGKKLKKKVLALIKNDRKNRNPDEILIEIRNYLA